jgi:hypothetical protein
MNCLLNFQDLYLPYVLMPWKYIHVLRKQGNHYCVTICGTHIYHESRCHISLALHVLTSQIIMECDLPHMRY